MNDTSYAQMRTIKLVGQKAGGRERVMAKCYLGATVQLVPEPDNPYDSNAVAIHLAATPAQIDGASTQMGYVPRKLAERIRLEEPLAGTITDIRYPPPGASGIKPGHEIFPIGADIEAPIGLLIR